MNQISDIPINQKLDKHTASLEKSYIPNVIQNLVFSKTFALDFYQAKQLLFYIGAFKFGGLCQQY